MMSTTLRPILIVVGALIFSWQVFGQAPTEAATAAEWVAVFPDATLDGWDVLSGEWTFDGSELVGRAQAGQTVWVVSNAEYADLELEVSFKTSPRCNGGVQFRGHRLPKLPIPEGVDPATLEHDMYGYQANIETRRPEGTGSLVDELQRGWLAVPKEEAQQAVNPDDWNSMRVSAIGHKIEISLNGKAAVSGVDYEFTRGRLALQVKGLDDAPAEIRFKDFRIRDLGRGESWQSLFNGNDLEGWVRWGTEEWVVEDGVIYGRSGAEKSEGYLATEKTWSDFHARGAFKILGAGNYGLFYHSTISYNKDLPTPMDGVPPNYPIISGVQGEVDPGYPGPSGWIYESYRRGWLVQPDFKSLAAFALRPNEWNEIEIQSIGNRRLTWINGIQVVDFEDATPNFTEGALALQLHAGAADGVAWKDLFVAQD